MSRSAVSMGEIRREGPWALRGLGYQFGIADRATWLLSWTEAVHGKGLSLLRRGDAVITASAALSAVRRTRDGAASWAVDAAGKCLFEVGPPAIDLATADLRLKGTGHVALTGAIGHCLVGALCDIGARRGFIAVAIYRSGSDPLPETYGGNGWIVAMPAQSGPRCFAGSVDAADLLWPVLHAAGVADAAPAIRDDLVTATSAQTAERGFIGLSALPYDEAATHPTELSQCQAEVDYTARIDHAYRHGVTAETADLFSLYELERRAWAPSSARSRAQAAF